MRYKLFGDSTNIQDLCFFDVETTGIGIYVDLLEIASIRVNQKSYEILDEFEIKVKPQNIESADPESLQVVGYSEEEWKSAVDLETAIKKFLEFTKDSILVANNLAFDWMWIHKAIEDLGLKPTYFYKGIDVFALAWLLLRNESEASRLSIGTLAKYFGLERPISHRAMPDTKITYEIFKKLMEKYEKNYNTN
jgi:DNA polymerase-3 subunit alpha (Gram-positive type)